MTARPTPASTKAGADTHPEATAGPAAARLGPRVREARERHGWTQPHLARVTGMTTSRVSRIETGQALAVLTEVEVLAGALGTTPGVLSGWVGWDGRITSPPAVSGGAVSVATVGAKVVRLPVAVRRADVPPGRAPVRVAGLVVVSGEGHVAVCGIEPRAAVPGHPELRKFSGCGLAVESALVRSADA